ncbi:hypothetical protein V9T40_001814 [Parthenolecanium corni]|uniref:Rab-GAP TBC domain-containing protein n=1 Tax=Parthenolecanium corni TaxID=536013 RepID=A0AAN9TH95_9HEMI
MNGLLVNSYRTYISDVKPSPEPKCIKNANYQTWPKRQKYSRKRKVSHLIRRIRAERAVSEVNLNFENAVGVQRFINHNFATISSENSNLNRGLNNQKRNHHLQEYDKKLKKNIDYRLGNNGIVDNDLKNINGIDEQDGPGREIISYSSLSESNIDESKLGIIHILKNWKLSKVSSEKECSSNNVAYSDTRSSVSSFNTLNESDSSSFNSDVNAVVCKIPKFVDYQNKVMSSSHLIQLQRPDNLPPKPVSEQMKHQKEYEKMVEIRKKKERQKEILRQKKYEERLKEEERQNLATQAWLNEILPNWNQLKNSKKTQNLWWNGLPPRVRGKVWSLSVGNKLNITKERYIECVHKSKQILKTGSKDFSQMNESYEHSVELIRLDISRTFPHLCIFQQGGPYYDVLHSLLGAYVCYQPEIGYVQGMSFIAAVLLLNMEEIDAFVCFANLLNKPCHKAFYSLDVRKMRVYYSTFTDLLRVNIYDLYKHVTETSLTPDLYLVDWIYTLFSKSMNLDLACRIWDLIVRDGEVFIFRAALGIMNLSKNELLKMDFLRSAQYLTKLPENMCPETLFKSISSIRMNNGSYSFEDLLQYYSDCVS